MRFELYELVRVGSEYSAARLSPTVGHLLGDHPHLLGVEEPGLVGVATPDTGDAFRWLGEFDHVPAGLAPGLTEHACAPEVTDNDPDRCRQRHRDDDTEQAGEPTPDDQGEDDHKGDRLTRARCTRGVITWLSTCWITMKMQPPRPPGSCR